MKNGKILKLFTTNKETRVQSEIEKLKLQIGGIPNDKSFKKTDREILITSSQSYLFMENLGIDVVFGTLGENILIDTKPYKLEIGTKLKCGSAILEISMKCPVCSHLSELKSTLPKLIKNERGIFAKVIKNGEIKIGDEMVVI